MSIVAGLSETTMKAIANSLNLQEEKKGDKAYMTLSSPMSPDPVGQVRVFHGKNSEKMVYVALTVDAIGLDSHMLFAFSSPESTLPHFTLDAVHAGPHYAFHLDMIPRVDLACNLDYIREVFEPLNEAFQRGQSIEGLEEAHLSRSQYSVMSPWMLAKRAPESAMDMVGQVCREYLDHWLSLAGGKINAKDQLNSDLAERDSLHRSILFSPEVDPVWQRVEKLLGGETTAAIRSLLLR